MSTRPPEIPHRRRARGGGPSLHPAHPMNRLYAESLFNSLSRYSTFVAASAQDIGHLAERAFGVMNPLLAQVALRPSSTQSEAETKLIEALGLCELEELVPLTCTPYLTREEAAHHLHSPMLCKSLRYCPRCLALGFHSMFYQHLAVEKCPHHRIRLLDTCIYCKRRWQPRIDDIIKEPFCCSSCRWLHCKTVMPPSGAEELHAADAAVLSLRGDLEARWRLPHERVSAFALIRSMTPLRESATNRRLCQRLAAWPTLPDPHWCRFREEALYVGMDNWPREGEFRTADWQSLSSEPTATLRWLVRVSEAPAEQCRRLLEGAWQRIQNITPLYEDRQLGAVATALHLTVSRYGWLRVNLRALAQGFQQHHPFHNVCWSGAHSESTPRTFGACSGRLIASEILGYFVVSLLRCAGLQPLSGKTQEFGQMHLAASDFCPSWYLERAGRPGWMLRMRHRASTKLVQRLLKRYQDMPLQRLVVSCWPTNPTIPEVASLNEVDFPPELVQFPRHVSTEPAHVDPVDSA